MKYPLILMLTSSLAGCVQKKSSIVSVENKTPEHGTFAYDVNFMKSNKDILVLGRKSSGARVLLVGDYQARVMTSTANGDEGNSYGWINYDLIRSGAVKPHINPFGGEDRFWLGPEGGQYALFFKKGDPFDLDHWQTPSAIDTEPFELVSADSLQATFTKTSTFINYQGTKFEIDIQRQIRLLENEDIEKEFGVSLGHVKGVAFESVNSILNIGQAWSRKKGLISIWILGVFNPSDSTTIIIPHRKSDKPEAVTDNYFGAIPGDRISRTDSVLFLKGDGKHRGKVGIAPFAAKNVAGSYDSEKHLLTIVRFDLDKNGTYVNSKWETQPFPFRGDAVNSYNDGPQADGSQLGPFYELESSSPVLELKKGEMIRHRHVTLHAEGNKDDLNALAEKILGVSLDKIKAFGKVE